METPKPAIIEDRDVILKVTGSTVCGSDLHLLHGTYSLRSKFSFTYMLTRKFIGSVIQLQSGDILGHEFCGKVESFGKGVKGLKEGDRVVASFQIACGDCMYCKKKISSQCERTNDNSTENMMYGGNTAGKSYFLA